jgi:hypothetical protein
MDDVVIQSRRLALRGSDCTDRRTGGAAYDRACDGVANGRPDHSTRTSANRAARQGTIDRPVAAGSSQKSQSGNGYRNLQ